MNSSVSLNHNEASLPDRPRPLRSGAKLRIAPPALRLTPSVHFIEQLGDRRFDLSILAPVYTAMIDAPVGTEKEFSIGRSSVIAVKTGKDEAVLKTGWKGDRTKR
jgi:hypothetical protein